MAGTQTRRGLVARAWSSLRGAWRIYVEIDGDQRAAAFGFYAFFSLFPLLLLVVSVGALFLVPGDVTSVVIEYLNSYIPLGTEDRHAVFETLRGIAGARGSLGVVAGIGLVWSSSRFFHALVRGVNRAWHTHELEWWRLPVKSAFLMFVFALALLIGILVPLVLSAVEKFASWDLTFLPFLVRFTRIALPFAVLFGGLVVLYMVSPRNGAPFRRVWGAAFIVTLSLKSLQSLLVLYTHYFWQVNALYGTVGVLILLLAWVYMVGALILFGACLSAASRE